MKKIYDYDIEKRVFVLCAVFIVLVVIVFGVFYPWASWKQALIISFASIVCTGVCAYVGYRIGSKIMK